MSLSALPHTVVVHVAEELLCNHAVLMDNSMKSSLEEPSYMYMYMVSLAPSRDCQCFVLMWTYTAGYPKWEQWCVDEGGGGGEGHDVCFVLCLKQA